MLVAIIGILIILWFLGYVSISGISIPDATLFSINGHPITLWNILILLVVGWAISILPRPLQAIASVLLFLWILSVLGILAIFAALPGTIVVLIILGLIASFFL